MSSVLADEQGQILEAHSVSAGLDYPGVGPEHAQLRDTGRARYEAVTDAEALRAFRELARLEGILPALEPAHAIAWLLRSAESSAGASDSAGGYDLLCLSGRGDKDLAEAIARLGDLGG
jgi:tryptophan synthase beta chain